MSSSSAQLLEAAEQEPVTTKQAPCRQTQESYWKKKIKIIEERNKSKKVKVKVKVHSAKIKRNETSVQKEKMENLGKF